MPRVWSMRTINVMIVCMFMLRHVIAQGNVRSNVISRLNRRKMIATRNNFSEKGSQAELIGSNLHLYVSAFSVQMLR